MSRLRCRPRRDSGIPIQRNTPLNTQLRGRDAHRRLLPNKHYDALPEVPEMEEMNVLTVRPTNPVLMNIKPVHRISVSHSSTAAFTENPKGKAVSPAAPVNKKSGCRVSPAGHPTVQMTPDAEAFKDGKIQVKEVETPESIMSSSMELNTAFSSEDDDEEEEEEDSSISSASSSLSSPEIFRKDSHVETLTFPIEEELNFHIKNSTMLDLSHAKSIHMHHPPNLSAINDASTILAENSCQNSCIKGPEAETKSQTDSLKSDKLFKWKTTPKLATRTPILCKKKVCFKSPMISVASEARRIPATKSTTHNAIEPVEPSSQAEQIKPNVNTSRSGEIDSKEEALPLTVRLKRPDKSNPETAKVFDFIDDSDRDAFFQKMRERCVKLRSAPLFPLTAAKHML